MSSWHRFWYHDITPLVEQLTEVKLANVQSDPLLGNYGDKKWHLTISNETGERYLHLPVEPKWKLGAVSRTDLFLKTDT